MLHVRRNTWVGDLIWELISLEIKCVPPLTYLRVIFFPDEDFLIKAWTICDRTASSKDFPFWVHKYIVLQWPGWQSVSIKIKVLLLHPTVDAGHLSRQYSKNHGLQAHCRFGCVCNLQWEFFWSLQSGCCTVLIQAYVGFAVFCYFWANLGRMWMVCLSPSCHQKEQLSSTVAPAIENALSYPVWEGSGALCQEPQQFYSDTARVPEAPSPHQHGDAFRTLCCNARISVPCLTVWCTQALNHSSRFS